MPEDIPKHRLRPDRCLLCPRTVAVAFLERLTGRFQRCRISGRLVWRDARPIQRLRCRVGVRQCIHDFTEATLGVRPLLRVEGDARAAYHQLGEQVVDGKKALDAVVLDAVGIQEKDRRRPRRLVALAVLFERVGILAWVHPRGDVPGLNPAIRAITMRALRDDYKVIGIRHGWGGLVDYAREKGADNSEQILPLTEAIVNRAGRTGGTFLHTSRVRPSHLPQDRVPPHLTGYNDKINDITKDVIKNLEHIGIDVLIPIGGDDTLSYAKRLHDEGLKVVAIPKTMDNDVYGTDYCIGFSTCVTRTIELTHRLRTSAGSHERFLVIEVFGRYA